LVNLIDKEWVKTLCEKLEQISDDLDAEDSIEIFGPLGNAACVYFDDKDWTRDLYKKAVELVEDNDDYEDLADSIEDEDYLGDEDWADEIRKKA